MKFNFLKKKKEEKKVEKEAPKETVVETVIKEGKKINSVDENKYKSESKKRLIFLYIVPIVGTILIACIYIPTQNNFLLIPFGVCFLVTLFGWDGSTRMCKKCGKWNSLVTIKANKKTIQKTKKYKTITGKEKEKIIKIKHEITQHECRNCGQIIEKDKEIQSIFRN